MENPFRPPILTPDKTDSAEDKKLVTKFLGEEMANLLDDNRAYTPEPQGITEEERKQALEEVEKLKAEVKPIPLEQKDRWNRKDLIQWALEQVGVDDKDEAEKWVDEYFTVNPDGTIVVCEKEIGLANNKTITILPPHMTFKGNVYSWKSTSLTTIPAGTVFNGRAYFVNCTSLTTIPAGTVFKGDAHFSECTSLASIPEGTVFNRGVNLAGCTSLTSETIDMLKEKKDRGEITGTLYLPNGKAYTGK